MLSRMRASSLDRASPESMARAAFSTRLDGVSEGPYESLNLGILTDDLPERVRQNRELLAGSLGLGDTPVAMGRQVHGTALSVWPELAPRQ